MLPLRHLHWTAQVVEALLTFKHWKGHRQQGPTVSPTVTITQHHHLQEAFPECPSPVGFVDLSQ